MSGKVLRSVPMMLIILRFLLGPTLLWVVQHCNEKSVCPVFIVCFVAAFLSDVFDGIIARRLHVDTKQLREYDGWVDVWFYGWVFLCTWLLYAPIVIAFRFPLLVVVSTQCISWVIDLVKYRRFANYHAYSSKAWGVTLFVAFVALFGFHITGVFLWLAIIVGIVSHVEEMLMSLTLPYWIHDVPSIFHAMRLRQTIMRQANEISDTTMSRS